MGRLKPGDRLPAGQEVAEALGINAHTVLHAYRQLRLEGLVDVRRGRGAVISAAAARLTDLHDGIRALVDDAAAVGIPPAALAALIQDPAFASTHTDGMPAVSARPRQRRTTA